MKVVRHAGHRYAMHSCTLQICGGRGYYETDAPTERFCDCPAGDVRRRMDDGEDVEVEWPACSRCGERTALVMRDLCSECDGETR